MNLHIIDTGKFKLDGGAMFGVVPKSMWSKKNPPDDHNMCTWAMRCLLIEEGERKILIDTGLGNKQDEKFRSHFYPHGEETLENSIEEAGFKAEDITDVFLTHFHFDHIGGALKIGKSGKPEPTFPNATYWTNELHYHWAYDPNAREAASFLKENFVPLKDMGMLKYIDVEQGVSFTDHISVDFVYGHTEAMMIPHIKLPNGKTLVYAADLLPSTGHIGLPWVMAYDIRPLSTLSEKAAFYEKVIGTDHYIYLEHDKDIACMEIIKNEKGRVAMGDIFNMDQLLK